MPGLPPRGKGGTTGAMRLAVQKSRLCPATLAALAPRWDALANATGASFFQRWTWIGASPSRFAGATLFEATEDGQTVGLALGAQGRWPALFHLTETGQPTLDSVFIEHNAPLATEPRVLRALMRAARPAVLSGVPDAVLDAAGTVGRISRLQTRAAPYCDLTVASPYSRNTRQALARSARAYGPLLVTRADDAATALVWFAAMITAHTATWVARGKQGALHDPAVLQFHRAVITRGVPEGTVDLLRITTAAAVVGTLYQFRQGTTAYAYQSGFDYAGAAGPQRPGLSCHAAAAAWYRDRGATRYDFLAGDSQYKRSLSTGAADLHWLRLYAPADPRGWFR